MNRLNRLKGWMCDLPETRIHVTDHLSGMLGYGHKQSLVNALGIIVRVGVLPDGIIIEDDPWTIVKVKHG